MDKPAIKKFAIWARNKLIADTKYRAGLVGVTETAVAEPLPQSTEAVQFFDVGLPQPYRIEGDAVTQRQRFVAELNKETAKQGSYTAAYQTVVDKVAYTWFNRLIAVRYMEVNDLLPSRTRVLSSADGRAEPQIVTSPFDAVLDYTPAEQQQIVALKNDNKLDEAFRLLFLKQCAALGDCLPRLFEEVDDYMPLLLALSFTDKDGVVCHLVNAIPESDWQDAVQIVGWLYQYYNTEPKEQVFANLKKNIKISKENIPAATQLFTPDWIVRYMVENSLGRLWSEGHPDFDKSEWKYYLDEAPQEPQVAQQLAELRKDYAALTPEDIKCIDPCMGSGHILAYLFDVLMQIYRSAGYTDRDAAASIVEHNLYGLDIDDRAAQMAYFVVVMKGCHYDSRFLRRHLNPHVYAIQESNGINRSQLKFFGNGLSDFERNEARLQLEGLLDTLTNAKEYGSILHMENYNWDLLRCCADAAGEDAQLSMDSFGLADTVTRLKQLIDIGEALGQKYDVVVTNPPYMGGSGMNARLSDYVKKVYPDSKSDLFAVFIERCAQMDKRGGYQAMITQHAWMFLSSFEKLRAKLQLIDTVNMAHLGARGFDEIGGEVVQTTSFVMRSSHTKGYKGTYCRLIDGDSEKAKAEMFVSGENRYVSEQDNFSKIPGSPVAYWASNALMSDFCDSTSLSKIAYPRQGMATTNNGKFLRQWYEVAVKKIGFSLTDEKDTVGQYKWFPYNKGGEYRKWYGNNDYVVNFQNKGEEVCAYIDSHSAVDHKGRVINRDRYFKPSVTWSKISSGNIAFRYKPHGFIFDVAGTSIFGDERTLNNLMGLLNSNVILSVLGCLSPTLNYEVGHICSIPVMSNIINSQVIFSIVQSNINISKSDWDSFETSWDFKKHPLV